MKIVGYRNKIVNQLKIENVFSAVSDDFLGMIKLFLNDKGTAGDTSIHESLLGVNCFFGNFPRRKGIYVLSRHCPC